MLALALIAVLQAAAANVDADCLVERSAASKEERKLSRAGWARTTKAARAFGARMRVQPEATSLPAGLDAAFRSGFVGLSFVLTAQRRVRDCTPAFGERACLAAVETMRFLPAVDDQGRFMPAIATRVVHSTRR